MILSRAITAALLTRQAIGPNRAPRSRAVRRTDPITERSIGTGSAAASLGPSKAAGRGLGEAMRQHTSPPRRQLERAALADAAARAGHDRYKTAHSFAVSLERGTQRSATT